MAACKVIYPAVLKEIMLYLALSCVRDLARTLGHNRNTLKCAFLIDYKDGNEFKSSEINSSI